MRVLFDSPQKMGNSKKWGPYLEDPSCFAKLVRATPKRLFFQGEQPDGSDSSVLHWRVVASSGKAHVWSVVTLPEK